ncbi:aminoglycoside phosphotransferase family protein [Actinopolymorpha sp. B17G11]|uniref:phosphotransferase family protein n=1 Tax=Actinopolymorpha sp. B17G11 TaxID=3160861 RepID=UPI0032E50E9B
MTTQGPPLPQAIRTAVVDRLPGADVQNAALIGEGIATRAYQVDDPSGTWVVRVSNGYPEPWRWRGGRAYEVPLLEALASRGLPVPQDPFPVLAVDGLPVAIVERKVAGQPLIAPPAGKRRSRLARQLASFLTVLHRIPVAEAHALGLPRSSVAVEARQHLDLAKPFLTTKVYRWLDQEISWLDQQDVPTALVHTDIRAEHLYLDTEGDLVGVIDFGDAAIGDPARDFAKIAGDFGDRFVHLLLSHYRGPAADGILARSQLYRRLDTLWEVAEDAWGERPSALRRLRSLTAAATRARQARSV